jgi:hypothetical protein
METDINNPTHNFPQDQRDSVELFDRIWEKANEKAQKECPNDPIKKQEKLERHIHEMLVLVEQPVPEIENHITNNPKDNYSQRIIDILAFLLMLALAAITFLLFKST